MLRVVLFTILNYEEFMYCPRETQIILQLVYVYYRHPCSGMVIFFIALVCACMSYNNFLNPWPREFIFDMQKYRSGSYIDVIWTETARMRVVYLWVKRLSCIIIGYTLFVMCNVVYVLCTYVVFVMFASVFSVSRRWYLVRFRDATFIC